jgi:hypothetical protein
MHRRAWTRLGISVALLVCVGCGDDDDCGPATPGPFPTVAQDNTTRTPGAEPSRSARPSATPAFAQTPTQTGPTTPGAATPTPGSETPIVTVTPSFTPTSIPASDGVLHIQAVRGNPGATVTVEVTLKQGTGIVGTQNDILFDGLHVAVRARENGRPDCIANPDLDKDQTVFGFLPPNCTADVDCTSMRAIVISFQNLDPIPTGSVLYSCNVTITDEADIGAEYPLSCALAGASDPDGVPISLDCEDGRVVIGGN